MTACQRYGAPERVLRLLGFLLAFVAPAATLAGEVEVLRGADASALTAPVLGDLVVLRGARVGGPLPELACADEARDADAEPPPPRWALPPQVTWIVIPVSITSPVTYFQADLPERRSRARSVWRRPARNR